VNGCPGLLAPRQTHKRREFSAKFDRFTIMGGVGGAVFREAIQANPFTLCGIRFLVGQKRPPKTAKNSPKMSKIEAKAPLFKSFRGGFSSIVLWPKRLAAARRFSERGEMSSE
jgi:hypothetical protein